MMTTSWRSRWRWGILFLYHLKPAMILAHALTLRPLNPSPAPCDAPGTSRWWKLLRARGSREQTAAR